MTARKLYVRVLPEVTLTGYTRAQCRFCSGTEEDPALRVRRRDHDISLLDTAVERSFSVAPGDAGGVPRARRTCCCTGSARGSPAAVWWAASWC